MLIVLMESPCIIDISGLYSTFNEYLSICADHEFDSLLVCIIIRFFFICLWGGNLFTNLGGSRTLGSIGINWGIGYCENAFASFSKWFMISSFIFDTRNTKLFLELFTGINSILYSLFHILSHELQ